MRRFANAEVGVANGSVVLFSAFDNDGPMWTGEGVRVERHQVKFTENFVGPPVVHVSLSMWDIANKGNQRADIQAVEISREGFVIEFRTWGDTKVARVRADWMAIGALRYEDDWDVE